jgi:lipopolysaccharide export system protein LptA
MSALPSQQALCLAAARPRCSRTGSDWRVWAALALVMMAGQPVLAERADRGKPMEIDAGRADVNRKTMVVTYSGSVTIRQGSLSIVAERIELREHADGRRTAIALGAGGKPATYRQKSDGRNEFFEGAAERIEYDNRSDVVRFVGNAAARRLVGSAVADEITGALIAYDSQRDFFSVEGRTDAAAGQGAGRIRAVISPRGGDAANPSPTEAVNALDRVGEPAAGRPTAPAPR